MARPRQISDEQILTVARNAFLAEGANLSTTAIADLLGISQSVLFQRFGTKEKLLIAALAPNQRPEWLGALRAGPDQRETAVQLLEIAQSFTSYFQEILPTMVVLRQAGLDLQDLAPEGEIPAPLLVHLELTRWFERAQAQGRIRQGDPAAMALAFQGALQIRPYLSHVGASPQSAGPNDEYLRGVVEAFWWGLDAEAHPRVA
jgi:AcrR family transcriptional regulator